MDTIRDGATHHFTRTRKLFWLSGRTPNQAKPWFCAQQTHADVEKKKRPVSFWFTSGYALWYYILISSSCYSFFSADFTSQPLQLMFSIRSLVMDMERNPRFSCDNSYLTIPKTHLSFLVESIPRSCWLWLVEQIRSSADSYRVIVRGGVQNYRII